MRTLLSDLTTVDGKRDERPTMFIVSNLCKTSFISLYIIPVNLFHDVASSKFLISLQQVNTKNIEANDGMETLAYLTSDMTNQF